MSMEKDDQRLGLVREILQVIVGLDEKTETKVLNIMKNSSDTADIRTPNIKSRIGNHSMQYLRNAIKHARSEGRERHDDDDDIDNSKYSQVEPDVNDTSDDVIADIEKHTRDEKMKENFTLMDFLLMEMNPQEQQKIITVDANDPNAARQQINQARVKSGTVLKKQQLQDAQENLRVAQASGNPQQVKLAMDAVKMARDRMFMKDEQQSPQSPQAPMESDEFFWTDEDGNILSEATVRQWKRQGNKLVKKFRCTSGTKKGSLVQNASDCSKRKDPKKVRTGRKTMKSKGSVIKTKSKITKRTSISKILKRLNAQLMGKQPKKKP